MKKNKTTKIEQTIGNRGKNLTLLSKEKQSNHAKAKNIKETKGVLMKTPQNQKRLTNVAIVRLKKGGMRVEVACYPNTVEAYRDKIETDLDNVLQSRQIFVNVSKGQLAKLEEIEKAFATSDEKVILQEIVLKGELQIGEKERELGLQKIRKEICSCLAAMSVNPNTLRPYAVTLIEKVMQDVHFKVDPRKPAKKQAKELLEVLSKNGQLPIQRAKMRLKITVGVEHEVALCRDLVWEREDRTENEGRVELVVLVQPGLYRQVEEVAKRENAVVLLVSLAVAGAKDKKEAASTGELEAKVEALKIEPEIAKAAEAPVPNKRVQKEEQRLAGLTCVLNDDDNDDWKNEGKTKKRGKGNKKKK
jgi:ribosome maturation protein SDO1